MQPFNDGGDDVGIVCWTYQTYYLFRVVQAFGGCLYDVVDAVERHQLRLDCGAREIPVLAKTALQVAMGKENVANTLFSREGRLLTGVGKY